MTDQADKTVSIEFVLDPEAEVPKEMSLYSGSFIFYFPFCHVYNDLSKDVRIVSMPKNTRVIDLMRRTDIIRIVGTWYDDDIEKLYDSITSFQRLMNIRFLCKYLPVLGKFEWVNKTGTSSEVVMGFSLDADQEPGGGDAITYNFEFLVLDRELEV
jgi:hypothetical protein